LLLGNSIKAVKTVKCFDGFILLFEVIILIFKNEKYKTILKISKSLKKVAKLVDFLQKSVYNRKACKISDEVRCGYSLWNNKVGGNSYGVCRGLDQGGKLFKIFRLRKIKNALEYMKQSN